MNRRRSMSAVTLLLAGALAGCASSHNGSSGGSGAPATAASTLDQHGLSARMSLGLTEAQLQRLNSQPGSGSTLTPAELHAFSQLSISIDVVTTNGTGLGTAASSPGAGSHLAFDLSMSFGSSTPVELREVGNHAYVRYDPAGIGRDLGVSPAVVQQLQAGIQRANAQLPGLDSLASGGWVSADLRPLEELAKQDQAKSGQPPASPADVRAALADVATAFDQNSTTTAAGTSAGRQEQLVTVDLGAFVNSVVASVGRIPGFHAFVNRNGQPSSLATGHKVTMEVFRRGGSVVEVDIDLNQFKHHLPFAVPLRIQLGPGAPVTVPASASPVDPVKAVRLLGQAFISNLFKNFSAF